MQRMTDGCHNNYTFESTYSFIGQLVHAQLCSRVEQQFNPLYKYEIRTTVFEDVLFKHVVGYL